MRNTRRKGATEGEEGRERCRGREVEGEKDTARERER